MRQLRWALVALWLASAGHALGLADLLGEMITRDVLARLPEPAYTSAQASSYDRASKDRDTDWFANGDFNQFVRTETNGGRQEWVLMDVKGPGAVVRIWSANAPEGCNLRFYFDGASEPGWTYDFQQLTNGTGPVAAPLSAVRSRGWNLYLPIPYAQSLKVTADKDSFYYQVGYRTYAPGTAVESFRPEQLVAHRSLLEGVQQALLTPPALGVADNLDLAATLAAGAEQSWDLPAGPAAVRSFSLRLDSALAGPELEAAWRGLVVRFEFDGEDCVWVPASDFFGSGVGINVYHDWYRSVSADGTMLCRWVMPYEKTGRLTLQNLGAGEAKVTGSLGWSSWGWDARSMHFRAGWHWTDPLPSRPMTDYNYLTASGQGVYVGDNLAVYNPVTAWWGEGDEKIFVDGETFPSTFGTGTEDYYGYAWCDPTPFTAPFHAQPRCDGPGNMGHTSVTRVRSLDAIPFSRSLTVDMEAWHWAEIDTAYASTVYWYARPGATSNRRPQPAGAAAPIHVPPPPFTIEGGLDAQDLPLAKSDGLETEVQPTNGYSGLWTKNDHLWVRGRRAGDFVELTVPAQEAGPHKLTVYATKSWDYGILKITVNGQPAVDALDTWSEAVTTTGAVDLGVHEPVDGKYVVRFEVVGKNAASRGTGSYFGLDALAVTKP